MLDLGDPERFYNHFFTSNVDVNSPGFVDSLQQFVSDYTGTELQPEEIEGFATRYDELCCFMMYDMTHIPKV